MSKRRGAKSDLWRELERIHGKPLPEAVRAFLVAQHGIQEATLDDAGALDAVTRTLADLDRAGLWPAIDTLPSDAKALKRRARKDPRWRLERALQKRRAELLGQAAGPAWSPVQFARQHKRGPVIYRFDQRLLDKTIVAVLARELPRLRRAGWLRSGRPLRRRELALLRHVCLFCTPTQSWRERAASWRHSAAVEAHPGWGDSYRGKQGTRRFKRDFRSAEAALGGGEGSLALFYDPTVAAPAPKPADVPARRAHHRGALGHDSSLPEQPHELGRVAPGQGAALRERFAAGVRIEELTAQALAGDSAAADEAIALCRRWRPAALTQLLERLGRSAGV